MDLGGSSTVDEAEVDRFSRLATEWWDPRGKMAPLHKLNPVRLAYIRDQAAAHFDRGPIIAAYSIAILKGGEKSREVMSIGDIEGVRSKSKAQKGPWDDPIFYPEMVRKTVARRHSKALPMSTDLETAIERDDELYDLGAREQTKERHGGKPTLSGALDTLAKLPAPSPVAEPPKDATPSETIDEETGEVIETPVVETLLKEIEALPTLEACSEWQWQTSEKYGDLHPDDAKKIHKAMLAHQSKLLKKGRKGDAA